jgi:WD40 repeat protein
MMHGLGVTGVVFSPDGKRLATASWDRGRIWDAETGAPLTRAMEEQSDQVHAAFSPDGRYALTTSGFDRTTCIWDAHTGQLAFQPIQHYRIARCAAFHPDGHLLICGGSDGMVRVWDLSRTQHGVFSTEHSDEARAVAVSADGRHIVTSSRDRTARVLEASTGTGIARLYHGRGIQEAIFRPGASQVLTAGNDGRIVLWDFRTGDRLYAVDVAAPGEFHTAIFDAKGDLLVTSNQQGVAALRDATTGAARAEPLKLGVDTRTLAVTRDGRRLCAGSADGSLRVMVLPDWRVLWQRTSPCGGIAALGFNGRGDRLASGHGDGSAWIRDAASGERVAEIGDASHHIPERGGKYPHSSHVTHVEFSPDDRYLLTASLDGDARVWDAGSGVSASNWLHHGIISSAAFSPDGLWIATASRGGTGRVWDWRTAEPIAPPLLHEADVKRIAFDPRAERVFTASLDGSVKGWSLSRDDRPAGDLVLLAQILSGERIQGGGVQLLTPPEIEKDTQYLCSKYPEEFSISSSDVLEWHRSEVALSERRSAWWSLIWHADRLLGRNSDSLPPAERASLHGKRARAGVELGRLGLAARDYRDAFQQDPRDHEAGYRCVLLSLAAGDEGEARQACCGLVALSAKSDLYQVMKCAVRACLLVPQGASDLEEAVRLARKTRDQFPSADSLGALGAALYRAGKLDEATIVLNAARLYHPKGAPQLPSGNIQDQAFLAMAFHDAGLEEWAAEALARAERWTRETIDSGKQRSGADLTWDEKIWLETLVKQARAHLGK